jgi:hypothetical protein
MLAKKGARVGGFVSERAGVDGSGFHIPEKI